MSFEILAIVAFLLAAIPCSMVALNLVFYRRAPRAAAGSYHAISVLIPARDEEQTIGRALAALQRSVGVELEVVVMDDASTDGTAEIVQRISREDPRVRLASAPALPAGWCGKQHACAALAREARHDLMLFVDADVTLKPDALSRIASLMESRGLDLLSGVPRQLTGTLAERMLLPLIHFVLLGFLPFPGVRFTTQPAYSAGCGQLMAVRRSGYLAAGGHEAIRNSRHDGITLPRAFRKAGRPTDLFDATDVADCRMYDSAAAVWSGLAKNATEGMASPGGILPWTALLFGGQVLPLLLAIAAAAADLPSVLGWALAGTGLAYATRFGLALRFGQSWIGALLHPFGILGLLAIQWFALLKQTFGQPVPWKGRTA